MSTWYRQGTISVTNGIATVTGIGTAWGAANTHPGDVLLAPDGKLYEILSVDSVTQLTIKPTFSNQTGYQGTTDTSGNAKYAIAPLVGSTTTADLAQRISAILTAWQDRQDELSDWQGGTVTGGDGNGYYPLTDSLGAVTHVMCPAKITAIVGNLDTELTAAQGYATSAQSSATSAQTYASQAGTSATNASNSATAASTSATNANNSATSASSSAATATTKASEASSSASSASSSASVASTSATNAANSASAAAASAASIDTSNFVDKTTTQTITGAKTFVAPALGTPVSGDLRNCSLSIPPAIGGTTPNTGAFSNLSYTGTFTGGTGVIDIGSGQIYKTATGNVLIGTTTDDGVSKLQVNGSIFSTGLSVSGTFGQPTAHLLGNCNGNLTVPSDGLTILTNAAAGAVDTYLIAGKQAASFMRFGIHNGTSLNEYARITSAGNLLIGTTTDDGINKLQVNGGAAIIGGIRSGGVNSRDTIYSFSGATSVAYNTTQTITITGFADLGRYLIGWSYPDGGNTLGSGLGVVITGYNYIIAATATLKKVDYSPTYGTATLQNFNNLGDYQYSEGNGNKVQIVFFNNGTNGTANTLSWWVTKIA